MSIRHSLKLAAARALTAPVVGRIARRIFRERVPGSGCVTETTGVDDRTVAVIMFGMYEAGERRFIRQYLPRDRDVIELGGSLGIVTKAIRHHVDPARRVVTVEADRRLATALARNLSNVEVVHAAIDCSGDGATTRFASGRDNLSGKLGVGDAVPRRTLTQIVTEHGVRPFALVCDIEGAEAGLLLDDADAFRDCTHVVIETHATTYKGQHLTSDTFREHFEALGFRTAAQHGPVFAFERPGAER